METITETLSNGNTIHYKVVNGTAYHMATPDALVTALETARITRSVGRSRGGRVRVFYGDSATGRDWGEEHDVTGFISRSWGPIRIPLLIYNRRSYGGGAVLDDCIVKLVDTKTKRVLWEHPNYHQPVYTVGPAVEGLDYGASVFADGQNVANFQTANQAVRWVGFMTGARMAK